MSTPKENILDRAARKGLAVPSAGMSVPEGYFDSFAKNMEARLPYREEIENPQAVAEAERPRTLWQKVRPYVYMAAMFAGASDFHYTLGRPLADAYVRQSGSGKGPLERRIHEGLHLR